jgi:predicted  nucleic acid-binding Zn-ribbon protein
VLNARDDELSNDYRKQLLIADSLRSKREQELLIRLQQEKDASMSELERYREQMRKLEDDRRKEREEAIATKEELRAKSVQALYAIEESKRQRQELAKKRWDLNLSIDLF